MVLQQVQEYSKRKELSNKAKQELTDILKQFDFSDESELREIVVTLYGMHPDVLSGFISGASADNVEKIKSILDYKNANKSLHVYVAVVALFNSGHEKAGSELLEKFIAENAFVKKINKQVFIGLDKVFNVNGAEKAITSECFGWSQRNVSGFRKIWMEAAEYLKNDRISDCAMKWMENNKIIPIQKEKILLEKGDAFVKDGCEEKIIKQQDKNNIEKASFEELLKALTQKAQTINEENLKIKTERDGCVKDLESLRIELLNVKTQLAQKSDEIEKKINEIEKIKQDNDLLTTEFKNTKVKLAASIEEGQKLQLKLKNVESAYGQAGKTEIESVLDKIKNRLSSEHEKYIEIKSKEPDMDYYEVLIAMLDEIYRVLKKNGITF